MKIISLFTFIFFLSSCSTSVERNKIKKNKIKEESKRITYQPKDGIIKIYGAGGPQTAIKRVAEIYKKETNQKVEVFFGPESKWTKQAQANADIIWGTAEQDMTAFLETYKAFKSANVQPIYLRPAVIAVKKGNPKNIQSIDDLLKPNINIVVVEGAGVYNTSGTGVWEDVVGRLGKLEDLIKFRKNISDFAKGSGAGFKAFKKSNTDAWITWGYWVINHPEEADMIKIEPERAIYRDLTVVTNKKADPESEQFIRFLTSDQAIKIFESEGWKR